MPRMHRVRAAGLGWSLLLGVGFALLLILALAPGAVVEARVEPASGVPEYDAPDEVDPDGPTPEALPDLTVWKGLDNGYARPGGVFVYSIAYHNQGSGVATDTLIVDTLPASTTYAGDTSGVAVTIGAGGVIT